MLVDRGNTGGARPQVGENGSVRLDAVMSEIPPSLCHDAINITRCCSLLHDVLVISAHVGGMHDHVSPVIRPYAYRAGVLLTPRRPSSLVLKPARFPHVIPVEPHGIPFVRLGVNAPPFKP